MTLTEGRSSHGYAASGAELGRANLALATLFLGMFVIGSTELLVVGVLDLIAADLRVSIPAAGSLVTAYALGLAIGGPILTALTIRLNKRTVLVGALALFVLGNLVAVLTASFGLFLVARTLTGAVQGLFIAAAFAAGTSVVPPERMGRAIGVVISGVAVSGAVGVPVGTLVGQALGWRGSFTAAAVLAVAALIATVALVPSVPSTGGGAASQARHAFAPRVLAVLGLTVLLFASVYAALTYIVPFLQTVTGISGGLISVFLLAYGGAAAVGSFGGGRFADSNAGRTLIVGSIGVAASLLTAVPRRHDRGPGGAGAAGLGRVRHGHGAIDAVPRGQPGRPRWRVRAVATRLRGQPGHRARLAARRRGDRRLHRLRSGDHRPDHRRDRHPGRLGDQLPEAADGRCGRRSRQPSRYLATSHA